MKRPENYGKFGNKRGRPSKAAVAAMKEAEHQAELDRKANLPVYPMLTYEELRSLFDVDIRSVNPATVTDIDDITMPENATPYEWLRAWITQTGNPFLFKTGNIVVQMSGNLDPLKKRIPTQRHGKVHISIPGHK